MKSKIPYLETVILLENCRTFQEAGNKLGISGTAVSNQIAILEKHFASTIVYKASRKVSLTTFGIELAARGKKILQEIEDLDSWNNDQFANIAGKIRIICHDESLFDDNLLPNLKEFRSRYPKIALDINESIPHMENDEQNADIFWGVGQYLGARSPGLISKTLVAFNFGIYASPEYLAEHGTPKNIADLKNHTLLSSSRRIPNNKLFYNKHQQDTVPSSFKMNVSVTVPRCTVAAASQSLGIFNCADLSKDLQNAIIEGKLVPILEENWIEDMEIFAYYDPSAVNQNHIKTVIDFFSAKLTY